MLARLALLLALAASAHADLYDIRVSKVTDGVYVAARPEPLRPYVEGNVTLIINEHDVVVVDASGSPRAARKVIEELRKLTPNPVRYLIQTHIHRDHRFGAQEYVKAFPSVEIIAHPILREVVAKSGDAFVTDTINRLESRRGEITQEIARLESEKRAGNDKVAAMLRRYLETDLPVMLEEYRGIRNLPPTATFSGDKLTLHRGSRTIEILFLGRGDTDHDVVVYLPKEKVVAAGDMVVHPFPYGFSTNPVEWVSTLKKLRALDIDYLIPGHGDVQRGKTYLTSIIELIESVHAQVRNGKTAETIDLSSFEKTLPDDPIVRYYFPRYFVEPAVREGGKALKH